MAPRWAVAAVAVTERVTMKRRPPSLGALTAAALALPGLAAAQTEIQADYLYAHYREGDLPAARAASGQGSDRYEIDTHLIRLAGERDEHSLTASLLYETMSGASPWWVQPGADGQPVQVMSGASIREERIDLDATLTTPVRGAELGATLGYSHEDDYEAVNGGVEAEFTPESGPRTYSLGLGYSYDRIDPTIGASSTDVIDDADRDSVNVYAGSTWVINPQTLVQGALSFSLQDGYLSDPYKRAFLTDIANTVRDRRPENRRQWSLSTRLRHFVRAVGGAFHVDYRFHRDDWRIESHTLELAWHQTLDPSLRISPSIRWYSQSQAYFYAPFYGSLRDDGLASSDYRLSPYGALSFRLDLRKVVDDWLLGGGVEWYEASKDYALGSVKVENPGLIDYLNVTVRLGRRF